MAQEGLLLAQLPRPRMVFYRKVPLDGVFEQLAHGVFKIGV
jgi:hypothetical protein